MIKIAVRSIVNLPLQEVWDSITGSFIIVFDDGELEVNDKMTQYSRYVWELHRLYPGAPITMSHHLKTLLKGRRVSPSTHLSLIKTVLWDIYDHFCLTMHDENQRRQMRFDMAKIAYQITNAIYNDMSCRLEEYVISLDVEDFIEVMDDPDMIKMEENIQPTEDSITNAYDTISNVLRTRANLINNPISQMVRSGLISEKQLHQCLGPRGYLTDTNSDRFPHPVLSGYIHGIRTIHDNMIESRSAAKSMEFAKAPLQQAEYFSRRLQFVSEAVENLHHEDCGSEKYLGWYVRGREVVAGEIVYDGDLSQIVGKYYLDEKDGKLKAIKASDTHLIGKTIKMRSVMHCQHPDPSGICQVCFGQLSDSIPENTNLGQMCATYVTQQSSQAVLSVKHLDGTASVEAVVLGPEERKFLEVMPEGNSYKLADRLKGKGIIKVLIKFRPEEVKNLTDINEIDDVTRLPITRISEIKNISVVVETAKQIEDHEIEVFEKRRNSSLTHDMLAHVKRKGWTYDAYGNVTIDLTGWDHNKPIMSLPLRTFNMSDHSQEIAAVIESRVEDTEKRDNFTSPQSLLVDLFTLVNEKLNVNLAILEVVLYAAMIVSAEENDYALPKPWGKQGMGVMRMTMDYRNLAPRMAYERHCDVITNPATYLLPNRFEHIFDALLMPREVTNAGVRKL